MSEPDLFEFTKYGGESEEDISDGLRDLVSKAVLWSTDWTIETICNQLTKGNINLDPEFQRREAWTDSKKSLFIESILIGLPIPQIVLAERKDRPGSYLVIDGKQRLLTLRRFCAPPNDPDFPNFPLRGLSIRKDLNGFTFQNLCDDPDLADDSRIFENQTVRTTIIRNWPTENFLYTVFLRLNTGSLPLSPQELRQALHPGPFLNYADDFTRNSKPFHRIFGKDSPDFRMRDVELFVRYISFRIRIKDYRGNLKGFLDDTCKEMSMNWGSWKHLIESESMKLNEAIDFTHEVFGDNHAFRKWSPDGYESRFNRAVFDIMTYYFSEIDLNSAFKQKEIIVDSFKYLCEFDVDFRQSIETTTKSIQATNIRFSKWADVLSQILGSRVNSPVISAHNK